MVRSIITVLMSLVLSLVSLPASAACGANGDEFEITFTEETRFLYCDAYDFEFNPDMFVYEFPLDIPSECTSTISTAGCELNGTMSCEVDPNPYSNGRTWWTIAYYDVPLVDNATTGTTTITVEDEWGGFICYLAYSMHVSEI